MSCAGRATAIYQAHLDRVTCALWGCDYAAGARAMHYPHCVRTPEGETVLHAPEEMARAMRAFRERLADLGATDYGRRCVLAAYHPGNPERIDGVHRTFVLRRGKALLPAYESVVILRRTNGIWRSETMILSGVPHALKFFHPASPRLKLSPGGDDE